jgi:hypothetical protein
MKLAPLFVLVAACATEAPPPPASLDEAEPELLDRLMLSAVGDDALAASGLAAFAQALGDCPAVAIAGATTTVTGGCLDDRGNRWEGSLTILDGTTLEFDALVFHHTTSLVPSTYDGRLVVTETSISGDITIDRDGIVSRSVLDLTVDGYAAFTVRGPSSVEVDGVARADISGSWKLRVFADDPPATGEVVLTAGADTALLDLEGADASGCLPYSVNGVAAGELCYEQGF